MKSSTAGSVSLSDWLARTRIVLLTLNDISPVIEIYACNCRCFFDAKAKNEQQS
jgi:hypothetical protein